jgi:predicted DNA-binding protein
MLSVRLNGEVEKQLEFLALTKGLSKNQLVTAAIEHYLKMQDLGTVPLSEQVREAGYDSFMHAQNYETENAKQAVMVAEMAQASGIWSGVVTGDGGCHGAIYGRNIVLGYAWSDDSEVMVISRHLSNSPMFGTGAYRLHVTPFNVWKDQMRHFPTVRR